MKIKVYGTAAAEGIPGLFCECEVCERARKAGGRNIRTRTQALVNDKLLIDLPPDTLHHVYTLGLPLHKIEHLIITHRHSDHLYERDLLNKKDGYAHPQDKPPLNIYGTQPTIDKIAYFLQQNNALNQGHWILHEVSPFEPFKVEEFTITPYAANHDFSANPVNFDIFDGKKRILYGNDTGRFLQQTWDYLEKERPHFDFVSLDCTCDIRPKDCGCHMNFDGCIETKKRFIELGLADENTLFYLHHFSHNGLTIYDELVPIAQKQGFDVTYDGMEIEF